MVFKNLINWLKSKGTFFFYFKTYFLLLEIIQVPNHLKITLLYEKNLGILIFNFFLCKFLFIYIKKTEVPPLYFLNFLFEQYK